LLVGCRVVCVVVVVVVVVVLVMSCGYANDFGSPEAATRHCAM